MTPIILMTPMILLCMSIQWTQVQKFFFFKNLTFIDIAKIEELVIFCNENITEGFFKRKITWDITGNEMQDWKFNFYNLYAFFHISQIDISWTQLFYSVELPQIVVSNYTIS